jgi:hypothetical protein
MRRGIIVVATVFATLALGAASANAGPTTETIITETGWSEPYTPDYACLPAGGSLSQSTRDVLHISDFGTGVYHYAETFHGEALFVTAEGVEYTGTVTSHFQINSNKAPNQYTVSVPIRYNLRSATGDILSFTGTEHFVGTPSGRSLEFDVTHCPGR